VVGRQHVDPALEARKPSPGALPEGPEPPPEPSADLLLLCLRRAAAHFGRPASQAALSAGLPVPEAGFDPALALRSLGKVGIHAALSERKPADLTGLDAPFIAWRADGRPLFVSRIGANGSAEVFLPEAGEQGIAASLASSQLKPSIITLRPDLAGLVADAPAPAGHWFWDELKRHWRSQGVIIWATAIINLVALAIPLFSMNVYDRVLPNKAFATLWVLAAGVGLAVAFDVALRVSRSALVDHVSRQIDVNLSSRLMERVLNGRLGSRGGTSGTTGAFTQRLQEYEFVRDFFASNSVVLLIDLAFAALFVAAIALIAWPLALAPIVGLAVMVGAGFLIQRLLGQELARAQYTTAHRHSLMVELVNARETIKCLSGQGAMLRRWDLISREASFSTDKIKRLSAWSATIGYGVQLAVTISIVIAGAYLFDAGLVTVGGIIACSMLAGRAVAPAGQLALSLSRMRQAFTALGALEPVMNLPDEREDRRLELARPVGAGALAFKDVAFSYGGEGRPILKKVSFAIAPGERVAILGRVGAGKTTLGRLMARIFDVDGGGILLDDVDIRQYHVHDLRRAVTFVGQEADLFHGTLWENLRLGRPEATDEQVIAAARLAGVDEFAVQHPQGYGLQVGERGNLLSSGQRHMVALARAFLRRGTILFLDDPSASMDMATERTFVARLKTALDPRSTLIVTTHRNAMLALVDRLIVIEGGVVVSDGPVAAVLQKLSGGSAGAV
jgi:ATP-binding cassette subfamily C protein LapB